MNENLKDLQSIALMLAQKEEGNTIHYEGRRIPYWWINVLPQPRKTFLEIETLGDDIAAKNILHPLVISRFDQPGCENYLQLINLVWKTDFQIGNLLPIKENDEVSYYLLSAGERRYRSCIYLIKTGCTRCREKFGPGGCYKRHFGDESLEVRLCLNVSPIQAIFIQASENIHMRVPAHEEAKFYDELFRVIRQADPKYPLARFARDVGRSPETVREAVKFCLLPEEVRIFVEKGQIPYGIACEIARIQINTKATSKDLEWWALRAIAGNYRVPDFRQMVTNHLKEYSSGQISLFTPEEEKKLAKYHFRRIVERQTLYAIWSFIHYLSKVLDLFQQGKLGKKDSPFSERSPVRVYRKLIGIEERLLPHFWMFLPKKERERAEATIAKTKEVLSKIDKSS